jgi:hypothetical protein
MGHLPIGRAGDDVWIALEQPHAEQPIMVRRLLFRRNAEPDSIWIERFGHHCLDITEIGSLLCVDSTPTYLL